MTDQVQVDVDFPEAEVTEDGVPVQYPAFKDAIYLSFADYSAKTPQELDALRAERYENWKQHLRDARNAPPAPAPVVEGDTAAQLQDMRSQAQALLDSIDAQLAALPPVEPAPEV